MFNLLSAKLKQQFNIKSFFFLQIFIIVLVLLLVSVFTNYQEDFLATQQVKLGLINEDQHNFSRILIDSFNNNSDFTSLFDIKELSVEDAHKKFNEQKIDAYIVIPSGFTKSLLSYQNKDITIYTHVGFPTKSKLLKNIFAAYSDYVHASNTATLTLYNTMKEANLPADKIKTINNNFSFEIISTAMNRNKLFSHIPLSTLPATDILKYLLIALPCGLIGFAMISSILYNNQNDQCGIDNRLACIGITKLSRLLSIHLSNVIFALINVSSLLIISLFVVDIKMVLMLILGLISIAFIWSVFWQALYEIVKNSVSFSFSAAIITLLIATSGGSFTPFIILPPVLKQIGLYTPIYATTAFVLNADFESYLRLSFWLFLCLLIILIQHLLVNRNREVTYDTL